MAETPGDYEVEVTDEEIIIRKEPLVRAYLQGGRGEECPSCGRALHAALTAMAVQLDLVSVRDDVSGDSAYYTATSRVADAMRMAAEKISLKR